MLILHITLASLGLLSSLFSLVANRLNVIMGSYLLIAAGAGTGVGLLIFGDASVLRVCIEGLIVSSISLALAITAQKRLVVQETDI